MSNKMSLIDFIDEAEGDPNVFYSYICPACHQMIKSHVFHMLAPKCQKCGTKTRHAETERIILFFKETSEWISKENELDYIYPFFNVQSLCDDKWNEGDVHHLRVLDVDNRRGVRIFTYDIKEQTSGLCMLL